MSPFSSDESRPNRDGFHVVHQAHDLVEIVSLYWARCSALSGLNLKCLQVGEELVLQGVVRTYYQKQLAQEALRGIPGCDQIRNEISVL